MAITGESIEDLAKKNSYTKQAFYDVFKGRSKSPVIRGIISDIVAKPVPSKKADELWDN